MSEKNKSVERLIYEILKIIIIILVMVLSSIYLLLENF